MALAACGSPVCPVVHVPRSHVPKIVDQYASKRRAAVDAELGLVVVPEREPRLTVMQRVAIPGETRPITFPVQAPLGSVQRSGDTLVFPLQTVRLDDVEESFLMFGSASTESELAPWNEEEVGCSAEPWRSERTRLADTRTSAVRAPEAFERRHYLGVQLGSTGLFQVAYRVRAVDRLHVDMGLFGSNGAYNTSVGLLFDFWLGQRTAAYLGAGGGALGAVGENDCGSENEASDCVTSGGHVFGYLRGGLAVRVGTEYRDVLGFDVGLWHGISHESGPNVSRDAPFTWPMAGFSYHRAL